MLVVRLSNTHAEGLNNANRVENEVASQYLVRQSLEKDNHPLVVPAVYAWGPCRFEDQPDEAGFGWSILEFKQGSYTRRPKYVCPYDCLPHALSLFADRKCPSQQ